MSITSEIAGSRQNHAQLSIKIDFNEDYSVESLRGQNALVTGGATGIGQACAIALAEAGAYVTVADVNEKDGRATAEDLTKKGLHAQFAAADVTSWASQVKAFKAALEFGPEKTLDIVVLAAGIGGDYVTNWLKESKEDENGDPVDIGRKVLDVNLGGVYNSAHLALYYFKKHPGDPKRDKQIVFVSSMAGFVSFTTVPDYCSSKWGVRGIFRALRGAHQILGPDAPRLRCNLLAPNMIKTEMTRRYWDYYEKNGLQMGKVEDCAHCVLRMCADTTVIGMYWSCIELLAHSLKAELRESSERGRIMT
jgi:5'-hydroxyaverantin dehydrogenase